MKGSTSAQHRQSRLESNSSPKTSLATGSQSRRKSKESAQSLLARSCNSISSGVSASMVMP